MPSVTWDTTGIAATARSVRSLQREIGDLRPFWPRMRPVVSRWMTQQFQTQGAWGGSRWAALTPRYGAWKAAHYPGQPILVRTGNLQRQATRPRIRGERDMMVVTLWARVASFHQHGTSRMVARPIIPAAWPAQASKEFRDAIRGYIADRIRRSGLA